jgi:hypothetical protein
MISNGLTLLKTNQTKTGTPKEVVLPTWLDRDAVQAVLG